MRRREWLDPWQLSAALMNAASWRFSVAALRRFRGATCLAAPVGEMILQHRPPTRALPPSRSSAALRIRCTIRSGYRRMGEVKWV